MRFELFDGPTSVGTVAWERPGRVRLEVRDPEGLGFLSDYFGGDLPEAAAGGNGSPAVLLIPKADWSEAEFERACLDLADTFVVVPRPVRSGERRERGADG